VTDIDANGFVEISMIRERLEPLALRESIAHLAQGQIDRLQELTEAMRHPASTDTFLRMDREFHLMTY
jgi:DNA-binding GntR family transcriptional regulator